jgi:DNA-binding NarL/FixJ family response regulator
VISSRPIRVLVAARPGLWSAIIARQLSHENDLLVVGRVHDEDQIRRMASETDPHVILLDRDAFGEGCDRVISRLRRKARRARTLVLATQSSDDTELAFLRAGAAGVVEKGRGFPVLLTALRAVAAGEQWAHRRVIAQALDLLYQAEGGGLLASQFTKREREVVGAVQRGLRNSDVAVALGITEKTVKRHLSNIFAKTGVADRTGLIRLALGAEEEAKPAG